MTAADVRSPSATRAPRPAWRGAAGARLAWLHARSRRVPGAVLALVLCALVLRAALVWHWTFKTGVLAQQVPMIIEVGAAGLVAVTTHSPFGEPERATGRWLPCLRLVVTLALTGLAIGILQLGVTGVSLDEGILVLARNIIGMIGLGLVSAVVTGGLLAWVLPMAYVGFCQYALVEEWRAPWAWPVRPPADRGAWIAAAVVYAVGLLAITLVGARQTIRD